MSKIVAACFVVLILMPFSAPFSTCDLSIFATAASSSPAALTPTVGGDGLLVDDEGARVPSRDTHAKRRGRAHLPILPATGAPPTGPRGQEHVRSLVHPRVSSSPVPVPLRI